MPRRLRAVLVMEGLDTGDDRHIEPGALTHRALPLTLMAMFANPDGGWDGHSGAEVAARIDTITRVDYSAEVDAMTGQTWQEVAGGQVWAWVGEGEFSADESGRRAERLLGERTLRGVSADLAAMEAEMEVIAADEDGWPTEVMFRVTAGEIAAATLCNIPAFRGCEAWLLDDDGNPITTPIDVDGGDALPEPIAASGAPWLPAFVERVPEGVECEPCARDAAVPLVASGGPLRAPRAWFDDPRLTGPTPVTITDEGRVYGHIAEWGSCHTGFVGRCVTPPRPVPGGPDLFGRYHTAPYRTAEGDDIDVGRITAFGGHAGLHLTAAQAAAHYDDVSTCLAYCRAGVDDIGIWVAGSLRAGIDDEQVEIARRHPPSGDWRDYGRGLELMHVHSVNQPGFPVVRALAASGRVVALVAAGAAGLHQRARRGGPEDWQRLVAEKVREGIRLGVDEALAPHRRDLALARARTALARRARR